MAEPLKKVARPLVKSGYPATAHTEAIQTTAVDRRFYSLSEVQKRVRHYLEKAISAPSFWVQAELSDVSVKNHAYCTLVESRDGRQVAKVKCNIWANNLARMVKCYEESGLTLELAAGVKVGLLCKLEYHELHGLSLNAIDIDPNFALGDLERRRRLILQRLTEENLLERNRERPLPLLPQRIGLIASRESASFGDFKETLSSSAYGFLLYLAETRVQGSRTEHSVVRSLEKLQSLELDLIVLVRGGGSQTELAYLDNERIARAIAFCRYPVWTGIGHETDTSVLDVVAARSFRTPTAAAEELLTRFQKVDSFLAEAGQRLRINAGFRLAPLRENLEGTIESFRRSSFGMLLTQKQTVDSSRALFSSSAKATVRHWNQKLDQWETMIRTEPLRLLESQKRQRRHLADRFTTTTLGTLKQWRQKVEHVQQSLRAQAPRRMASEKGCLEAGQSELLKSVGRLLSSHRELLACGCEQLEPDRTLRSLVRHRIQVQQLHEMLSRSSSRSLMTATAALQSERRRFQLERYLRLLTESQARLEAWLSVVKANDPQNALSRGYALLHDRHGRFITRLDEVRLDELYTVRLGDGEFDARAEEKRENE